MSLLTSRQSIDFNYLHHLLDSADDVTALQNWLLIFYTRRLLKSAVLRSRTKWVYLIRPWTQVWWHFWFISVFEIWATCVITGRCFTLTVVRYQISRRLTFTIVSLTSWSSVRKPIFESLPVLLAVASLIHHNVISSWINGRFTGLITSILNKFSAFSILGEVILRDPSQNHDFGH